MLLTYFLHVHSRNGYSPSDIPNPMANPESATACGRPGVSKSVICDPANLLSKDSKDVSEGFLNEIDKAEVALLVVNKMSSDFVEYDTIEVASEKFARSIHDTWGVGDKSTNNGVLVFLSIDDRAVYISTGSGSRRVLSSTVIDAIIAHMKPDLRSAQYGSAVEKAIVEIGLVFEGKKIDPVQNNDDFGGYFAIFFIGIIAIVGIRGYFENLTNQRLERGKLALDKFIKEVKNDEQDNRFGCTSCPICLDDFPENRDLGEESTSEAETNTNNRRPMELHCGHVFCFECLQAHLRTPQGTTCPICRQPVNPDAPPGIPRPPAPQHHQQQQQPHQQPGQQPGSHGNGSHVGGGGTDAPSCSSSASSSATNSNMNPGLETFSTDTRHHSSTGSFWRRRNLEYHYRLNRLRMLHPDVMTDQSYRAMSQAVDRESVHELGSAAQARITEVQRILTDAAKRAAAAKKGSSGSKRSSFGGGHSSGGKGGRW